MIFSAFFIQSFPIKYPFPMNYDFSLNSDIFIFLTNRLDKLLWDFLGKGIPESELLRITIVFKFKKISKMKNSKKYARFAQILKAFDPFDTKAKFIVEQINKNRRLAKKLGQIITDVFTASRLTDNMIAKHNRYEYIIFQ